LSNLVETLKTDIAFTKGDLCRTPGGDLAKLEGLPNLKTALFHRLMTVPGTLVHKPTYGVGVTRFENACSSFSVQQKLAALIVEQFELDPRVQSVNSVSMTSEDDTPEMTIITVNVTPIGYADAVRMTFTPFSRAA